MLKQNFMGKSDQEFLGLIGDHLVQLADLSNLDIVEGMFQNEYNVFARMHQDAVDAPKNTNDSKDE